MLYKKRLCWISQTRIIAIILSVPPSTYPIWRQAALASRAPKPVEQMPMNVLFSHISSTPEFMAPKILNSPSTHWPIIIYNYKYASKVDDYSGSCYRYPIGIIYSLWSPYNFRRITPMTPYLRQGQFCRKNPRE